MFANRQNEKDRRLINLYPEMLKESCFGYISEWNQNDIGNNIVYNVGVSEIDMNYHVFILARGNQWDSNFDGGFPTTLGGAWTDTGSVQLRGLQNDGQYSTHDLRVSEQTFYGSKGFSFRLTKKWQGAVLVCDLASGGSVCDAITTTTEATTECFS